LSSVKEAFVLWTEVEIEEPENGAKGEIELISAFSALELEQRYGLGWGLI
jgi:hypothetical protein